MLFSFTIEQDLTGRCPLQMAAPVDRLSEY